MFKVKVNPSGVEFNSHVDSTLLVSAQKANIGLGYSCQAGLCGECKAVVEAGMVDFNDENKILTNSELSNSVILTCLAKVKSDVSIRAEYFPELNDYQAALYTAKINKIDFFKGNQGDVAVVSLRLPPHRQFRCLPGQYIDLVVDGIKRSYSIANVVSNEKEKQVIELHIKAVAQGAMSKRIFNDLKPNSLVRFEGPKGTFFIKSGKKSIVFLATGTGFAPVKAIVENLISHAPNRNVHIYWGVSNENDFYSDLPLVWAKERKQITFTPVVSKPSKNYSGDVGYVQNIFKSHYDDLSDIEVYACGLPQMIESSKRLCKDLGLSMEDFYSDAFVPSA